MEKIDVRKLEPAAREQLRRTVIRMLGRGHSQTAVAAELGINRLTVHNWAKAH
ncbi:IS630 family transposase, partial [Azoarcus indigens]|nr:IS630 family transposase [Azoarcus indigens]